MTLVPLPPYPPDLKIKYEELKKSLPKIPKNNDFLKKIYEYLDIYNEYVKTFTKCKQSCGYCCDIPIGMTLIEAEYIKTYSKKLKIDTQYIHPLKIMENQRTGIYFKKCPFLNSQNDCSIYRTRPFACRTYHSLDGPEICKSKNRNNYRLYGAEDPDSMAFGKVRLGSDILDGLFKLLFDRNKNNTVKDIKDFFPIKR